MGDIMNSRKCILSLFIIFTLTAVVISLSTSHAQGATSTVFAVIGDYGESTLPDESKVATRIKSWNPDFIVTAGDNNYPNGAAATIDANIGQYFHEFICPYTGSYGEGAKENLFFPTLGNHDWKTTNAQPYLDYFTLPGNERYYDFTWGPVHFFMLDSDTHEPDGTSSTSAQAVWLQNLLAASTARWKLVIFHHAPYSSGTIHGSTVYMRWPFQAWGANAVLSGHEHNYERVVLNGFPYFVNGLGGNGRYSFGTPVPGSEVRYNSDYGAMKVNADDNQITFQFISQGGTVVDTYTSTLSPTPVPTTPPPQPEPLALFLNQESFVPGDELQLRTVVQPFSGRPADVYVVIVGPAGIYSVLFGNKLAAGVIPIVKNLKDLPNTVDRTILQVPVPPNIGGDYRAIIAFVDKGRRVHGLSDAFMYRIASFSLKE
jgi:tartrate-resistant acid phosphatase type 5